VRAMPRLRLRRAPASSSEPEAPPTVLVMTMVRDEAQMLPRWIRHYADQVGMDNLLILDDNSSDGSTDGLECSVHRLPSLSGKGFEGARMQLLSGLASGFLAVYDYVVFVDADEFLVPDPARHTDLRSFLETRRDREVVAPLALNVVHVPSVEGPLRDGEPVLGQRRFAKFSPIMCKPSIKRVPASWRWASHGIAVPFEVDPELYMVHLKFADRDLLHQVAAHRKALVDADGRARGSSWSREADEIVAALDKVVAGVDVDTVPEFDPREVDLTTIVEAREGWHRAVGSGQIQALRQVPLRRVPSSLLGRF
jgi:Glycosyl transferase family 2